MTLFDENPETLDALNARGAALGAFAPQAIRQLAGLA